jgi:hypothetical protein
VEWGDGITAMDVYMWVGIPLGDTAAGWGDRPITTYLEPGTYTTNVNSTTSFLLIPVTSPGYVASPSQIGVYVEDCTPPTSQASSTSAPVAPQTPATPDLETLPYTGLPLHIWAIVGLMAMGTGAVLVRRFSDA